ncbi:winged helix-turn-helix transcriptional regulator [Desulforamulus ruminis]|uniref:Helix-turn-helix HxlR type n=1 Tax=Desulforamulus ruminis (strain ATCC 23193 / DSM 2154 / NCIMB 8452 / DL) TaxID=696281 RepID=F6DQQ4_DESRL|nr:helix-turn-helix domain-containing protein [Desulforamulus ruminis]AEG62051.1 helix-turn-helix HxlR type [Desulforamulus ruminis DSM 2154]
MKNDSEQKIEECYCPIQKTLALIGGKWTLSIIRELSSGSKRFSQLQKSLPGISPKTLSSRLQELEKEAIVAKQVFPEVPPRVEYSLTSKGEGLKKVLQDLLKWGTENLKEGY